MKDLAHEIRKTVVQFATKITPFDEKSFSTRKNPGKWSQQEILGHLVDSAQNNIQRFVRTQYEPLPPAIVYDQDKWVSAGHYQDYSKAELIAFWVAANKHLCHILTTMDPASYNKQCMTGTGEAKPLTFFAEDYLRHLLHHLDQINHL